MMRAKGGFNPDKRGQISGRFDQSALRADFAKAKSGLKKKESLVEAAKRELLEETGYAAKNISVILRGPVSSGFTSDMATMVLATKVRKVTDGGGEAAEGEDITVHTVPIKNVDRWLKSMEKKNRLVEPKIYAGLYLVNNYLRKT